MALCLSWGPHPIYRAAQFFLDDEELKNALGISSSTPVGPHCQAVRVEPFSGTQIAHSLRWLPKAKANALVRVIGELPRLAEIAERPSLLFQLSQLWYHGRIDINDAILESATIVSKFVEYSLERQVAKQMGDVSSATLVKGFIGLRQSELMYCTMGSAVAALVEGRNNSLNESEFRSAVSKLWETLGENDVFDAKPGEGGALSMPIRERFKDRLDPVGTCMQAVRTHGVIEHDPSRSGFYKFSHKSFAEVLAAEVVTAGILNRQGAAHWVWEIDQPVQLIEQDAVFQFCRDLIEGEYGHRSTVAEHTAFARLTKQKDTLVNRLSFWRDKAKVKYRLMLQNIVKCGRRHSGFGYWMARFLLAASDFLDISNVRVPMVSRLWFSMVATIFGLTMLMAVGGINVLERDIEAMLILIGDGSIKTVLALCAIFFVLMVSFYSLNHFTYRPSLEGERLARIVFLSYFAGKRLRESRVGEVSYVKEFEQAIDELKKTPAIDKEEKGEC